MEQEISLPSYPTPYRESKTTLSTILQNRQNFTLYFLESGTNRGTALLDLPYFKAPKVPERCWRSRRTERDLLTSFEGTRKNECYLDRAEESK
jgi:hypothetical protein